MDSGMVSKIEKARRYAEEKDRVRFQQFEVTIRGGHADHLVCYDHGVFRCDCNFFAQRKVCSHTMAMERILTGMLVEVEVRPGDPAHPADPAGRSPAKEAGCSSDSGNAGRGTGGGTEYRATEVPS